MSMETTLRQSDAALLATLTGSIDQDVARPPIRQATNKPAARDQDQIVTLRPRPQLWLRKALVCGWSGYLLVSTLPSSTKLDLCLISLLILGTFRTVTVSAQRVTWSYRFGFLPFYTRQLSLKDQSSVETGWEERSGLGEAVLLGLWGACLAPLADWLCPWRGGPYRLWLKNSQGQRTLIWRGRVEKNFYRNHKLLSQMTKLPSYRAPASESQPNWL